MHLYYDIPCVKLSFLIYKSIIKSEIVVKTSRIIIDKYFICDIKTAVSIPTVVLFSNYSLPGAVCRDYPDICLPVQVKLVHIPLLS